MSRYWIFVTNKENRWRAKKICTKWVMMFFTGRLINIREFYGVIFHGFSSRCDGKVTELYYLNFSSNFVSIIPYFRSWKVKQNLMKYPLLTPSSEWFAFVIFFFVENVQSYLWHSFWYEEFWMQILLIFDNIVAELKITNFLFNLKFFFSLHLFFYSSQMFTNVQNRDKNCPCSEGLHFI